MNPVTAALAALALMTTPPPPPPSDPFLRLYAETRRFSSGQPTGTKVTADGSRVLFLRSEAKSAVQTLFSLDTASGVVKEILRPETLLKGTAQDLSDAEKARLERQRISARGFTGFTLSKDGHKVVVVLSGRPYVVELASGNVTAVHADDAIDPKLSPDATQLAYVKGGDLYVTALASGAEHRVTTGATATLTQGLAEFVAQEEMSRFSGYVWSPDSKQLGFEVVDASHVEELHLMDLLHPEKPVVPSRYPRAGKANVQARFAVVPVAGGKPTFVPWDQKAYPYLTRMQGTEEGGLVLGVMNRHQTEEQLLRLEPKSGQTRVLLTEKDDAWLNLEQAYPLFLPKGAGFLWRTERNGGPELELRNSDGTRKASWVAPAVNADELVGYDAEEGTLYFTAQPTAPTSVLMRAKLGETPTLVFPGGKGPVFESASLSKTGGILVVTTASLTQPRRIEVFHRDGGRVATLPSVSAAVPFTPTAELRKVGEGEGYWAYVIRPHHAVKGQKLPVIVEVYGGPTHQLVQASMESHTLGQWLADQGFLVVGFDNRGTPGRGRAWQRSVKGSFGNLLLEDQVNALHALAKEVPELDLSRVGIEGWSFGGYLSGLAALKRPDVYKAAVAGAPVVDWRDYDTFYTERYLGLPQENAKGYDESSLLTYAPNLTSALLLIHGTSDDNVFFMHSVKLSDALFRAGRPHEFLPLTGLTHMVPDPVVMERQWQRVVAFFKEKLR